MPTTSRKQLGDRGEALVAQWLQQQGWEIVAQQWHCPWGELDIVAHRRSPSPCLAFIEVKTRHPRNLDQSGRLAITAQKQRKLSQSAALFLADYVQFADFPCRFDVALVAWGRTLSTPVLLSQQISEGTMGLVEYIEAAFLVES